MIRAFALRPAALAGALAAAALLAACSGEQAAAVSDFKPVPVSPVIGDVPLGSPDAPVTLVEYAALTCHVCRDFAKQVLPRIKREYIDTGKVRYIYRDYPLESGPDGKAIDGFGVVLSSVARCKGADKFHELVDAMFAAQADMLDAARDGKAAGVLTSFATQHGMTEAEMYTCIDHQPELKASIKKSRDEGSEKGVRGTPGIFLNDEMLVDTIPNWENVSAAIEAKLAGQPLPKPGAPADASAISTPASPATPVATPPAQ